MIDHGLCISEHFVMDALDEQHTLAKLAKCVHRDPSALSLQVKKFRERAMKEAQYRQKIEGIKTRLFHNNSLTHAPFRFE